jgi:hypothetical protein
MMNLTLLAAQTAIGDTLAGGNPVLTPVSGEAQMNLWDMALKGGWIMAVLAVLSAIANEKSIAAPGPFPVIKLPSFCTKAAV